MPLYPACQVLEGQSGRVGEIQLPGHKAQGWAECCRFSSPARVLPLRNQLHFGGEIEDVSGGTAWQRHNVNSL